MSHRVPLPTSPAMSARTPHPNNQPGTACPNPRDQPGAQVPLRKKWPRLKKRVKEEELREETKKRLGYYPHDWQMQAALKVLEGNDGMVIAGTGKGKTIIFALLGLAAELSGSSGHYIIISPLKALEGDQVERMRKAGIKAVALNEDTSWEGASKALKSSQVHLLFASPEYLLRNPCMKKFYVQEQSRTRIFGVLVDEAHVIHEWAENFRKDYGELKTLRVILGDNVPWWALSATFTDTIFKTVYKTLSFGTSRPFWGIDVGIERPNLMQCVYPMGSATSTYRALIPFIPKGAETPLALPKTIIFFHSVQATRDACFALRALVPRHLHNCIQPFAAPDEESTKTQRLKDLRDGGIRVLCCTVAAGMGCDIPDIEVAVIYGVDSFVSFVQKGGRAGRDGKVDAKMVWLVEDWMFDKNSGVGGKRAEKWAKVDSMAGKYIRRQQAGACLREFTNQVLRPDPRSFDLPGFSGQNTGSRLDISWVVEDKEIRPKTGRCCTASSCCPPSSSLNTSHLANTKSATADSRHRLILNVLKPETSAAEEILGAPLGREGIRCSKDEKENLRTALDNWRTNRWDSVRTMAPMLSRDWVLGEYNVKKLVENTRLIINTSVERIDRRWVRALIDTVSDDKTVDELSSVIQEFHSGFFVRLSQRGRQSGKRKKVSSSNSQQCPPSPAMSTFSQDSYLDPSYPLTQHHTSPSKRKRAGRPSKTQQPPPQSSPQLPPPRTWPLPEPQLVSRPHPMFPPATHAVNCPLPYSPLWWNHPHQQPTSVTPTVARSPWYAPNVLYVSPPTQPTPTLSPFSRSTLMESRQMQPVSPSSPPMPHSQSTFPVASPSSFGQI